MSSAGRFRAWAAAAVERGSTVRRAGAELLAVGIPVVLVLLSAPGPFGWSVLAGLVACLLLPLRHVRAWLGVLAVLWGVAGGLGLAAQSVALFALGRRARRLRSVVPWLVLAVAAAIAPVFLTQRLSANAAVLTVVFSMLAAGGPVAVGMLSATRERLTASLRELERAREATVAARESAARAEERARIGREVHDSVGHHATLIAVEAAALAATTDDPATREAAARLRTHAKEALADMRSALRRDDPDRGRLGVAALEDLVAGARATGVDVSLVRRGAARAVAGRVDRAVFRVVQEGLTNAARHAPGAPVRVMVDWRDPGLLRVEVRNDRPHRPPAALGRGGTGLTGLHERVDALGGVLAAAPTQEGGFLLHAEVPARAAGGADGAVRADGALAGRRGASGPGVRGVGGGPGRAGEGTGPLPIVPS